MIMTPKHKDWKKFCTLLEQHLNMRKSGEKMSWNCDNQLTKQHSRDILKKDFPSIDIVKTMNYFESRGGMCDCEILFNVDKG